MKRIDLTGQRFSRLLVIKFAYSNNYKSYWLCKCDCGNEVIIFYSHLRDGHTKSCGCLQKERTSISNKSHGMKQTRFYEIFTNINTRCDNNKSPKFKDYGGRGIKNEWKSFEQFKEDMYEGYLEHVKQFGEKQTTIDRIDNNGNYCKENCRWATRKEQQNNKRNNHLIKYREEIKTLSEWSEITGIKSSTLRAREKYNWPIEEILKS